MARSLERRIYDAWHANRGMRLSAEDVGYLLDDDAVETRITNRIAKEFGYDEPGGSSKALFGHNGSIRAFRQELKQSV